MTTIREARQQDAMDIARVHILSRRDAMPWLPAIHSEADTIDWIEHVVLPHQQVWVAELGDRITGVAALDGHLLEQLYVLPDAQGKGVGSQLLQTAMQHAGAVLELWTFQRNAAARVFYERHGFLAVEFTDGTSNEEHEPDVLYRWSKSRARNFP